ncbi:MAG: hypothetical protein A2W98_08420 [Bacteroidetes bacterium GWF2_33_38]|nr:MAG: hypothetical protein A2W98_08420 [Bacteroidetes bacterium GWF2_33_38]OFY68029.1 MAG: hypothetical protein A2265_06710 [Bacteroidetes bacterium RIFOXYA12_FULL_33_9]
MLNLKKILSVKSIVNELVVTFLRFPFAIITSIAATLIVFHTIDLDYAQLEKNQFWYNIIQTLYIGISFFIATALLLEKLGIKGIKNILIKNGVGTLLLAYYFFLPEIYHLKSFINAFILAIVFHLLISFIPFYRKGQMNGFWQFNKSLFLRFFFGGIYSAVLYLGLALAIAAVQHLFTISVDEDLYFKLWIFIVSVFNTWFFLAGVPSDFNKLDEDNSYPKGLKIFTQYILLTIVSVYFIILYMYMFKIIVQGEWPVGWVSNLVLGFSIAGIFSLLLIYPVISKKESLITNLFSKLYFWAIIPLIVMLFMAIWIRIGEYGITENRYFVLILAIWLTGITIFMLFNKMRNIKVIPISLAIISFLSLYGPWSAFNVSLNSQMSRFENILEKNNLLENGKYKKSDHVIPFEENKSICSIVNYIVENHGCEIFQPLFDENLDSLLASESRYNAGNIIIVDKMGLKYIGEWQEESYENEYFYLNATDLNHTNSIIKIDTYDYFLKYEQAYNYNDSLSQNLAEYIVDDQKIQISFDEKNLTLSVKVNDSLGISLPIKENIKSLKTKQISNQLTFSDMMLISENEKIKLVFCINNMNGNIEKQDVIKVNNFDAQLFLKIK